MKLIIWENSGVFFIDLKNDHSIIELYRVRFGDFHVTKEYARNDINYHLARFQMFFGDMITEVEDKR